MLNYFIKIWNNISNNGVNKEFTDEINNKLIITNRLAVIFTLLDIPFLYAFRSSWIAVVITIMPVFFNVLTFCLIHFCKHKVGRIIFCLNTPTIVALVASIIYVDNGTDGMAAKVLILSSIVIPFIVFETSQTKLIALIICYIIFIIFSFDWLNNFINMVITPYNYDTHALRNLSLLTSAFIMISALMYYHYLNYISNKKINELLKVTEDRNIKIASQKEFVQKQNKKLQEFNNMKDTLFSIIAHDLRSPLIGLNSLLHLMSEKNISQEQFAILIQKVSVKLTSAIDLLNNLFHWANSQMKGFKVIPENINLHTIVIENIKFFKEELKKKEITVINNIDIELHVLADKNMSHFVIRNLMANAIKFSFPEGKIILSSKRLKDFVEVSVKDNGVGINEINLPKLFNPSKMHSTYGTKNEKGTGLGLIVCKDFIEKNGGTISVESEENKGSTFAFTLKLSIL